MSHILCVIRYDCAWLKQFESVPELIPKSTTLVFKSQTISLESNPAVKTVHLSIKVTFLTQSVWPTSRLIGSCLFLASHKAIVASSELVKNWLSSRNVTEMSLHTDARRLIGQNHSALTLIGWERHLPSINLETCLSSQRRNDREFYLSLYHLSDRNNSRDQIGMYQ